MLDNMQTADEVRGLARLKKRDYETKTVRPQLVEEALSEGWAVDRKHKKRVRLRKEKPHHSHLEDRVWMLLYRMGFPRLSGDGGASLVVVPKAADSPRTQIDVVGIDDEVAVAIECKSAEVFGKRPRFGAELSKHAMIRKRFAASVNHQYNDGAKRHVVLGMFLSNISLSDNDKARAKDANVLLFGEGDLTYYEELVKHLGPAAKYQFLADMLPGKAVRGLEIRVPAIRARIGGHRCYTFAISPEYLLKIAYVSHRAKGKPSDVDTYQRMLRKYRLNRIRDYITEDGIFPTNIVINLEGKRLQFDRASQDRSSRSDTDAGILGWLCLRPAYKSAWVIDGQHRLFAYSGHPRAARSLLSVLAFADLAPSTQAKLFIDINAKQKSVKRSLLEELYGELHWDAPKPQERVRAIISKAIQELDAERDSPFYQRIQKADESKDPIRCITLTSLFSELDRTDLYIAREKRGEVLAYGPLWAGDDSQATRRRTVYILKKWFSVIRAHATDWWDRGAGEGGGLAMNDSVVSSLRVLRSVLQHLDADSGRLVGLDEEDLFNLLREYADALGQYLGSLSDEDRRRFRLFRGSQGQNRAARLWQQAIRERVPTFEPPGLDAFLAQEKAETNVKAKAIIDRMEGTLQSIVLEEVRREFGPDESKWWTLGVPKTVRQKASQAFEDDDRARGSIENYLNLIDYKKIALRHWALLGSVVGCVEDGRGKDRQTKWIDFLNDQRKIVAHASSGRSVSIENLGKLEDYDRWLARQQVGAEEPEDSDAEG